MPLLILLISALIVSGCSSSSTSSSTAAATTPVTTTAAAVTTPASKLPATTTSAATPQYGGTLKLLAAGGFRNLGYPAINNPPFNPTSIIGCFDELMRKDESGNPLPNLCTSWKVDKDALTLTMNLQKGVKYHDGTDFNAQACKWAMDALIASSQGELPNVKSIDVIDDYTLRINMSKWDILIVNYFTLKAGTIPSPTAVQKNGKEWAVTNPVYTGPFKFNGYQQDVYLKYIKNTNYWRPGKPYFDAIEWSYIIDETTRKAAFQAGEGQVNAGVSALTANELKQTGNYKITTAPQGIYTLFPDSVNADSPWSNLKVRQAAAYAIDNKTIANTFGYGFYPPTNQIGFPGYAAYNPDIKGYPYDPAKAKALLAEAGYPNGFKTTLYSTSNSTTINQAVQGYWKTVGIDADLQIVEQSKNSDLDLNGWKNGVFTGHAIFVAIGYPAAKMFMLHFSKSSIFFKSIIHPEETDQLLDKSFSEPTMDQHNKDLLEINRLLVDKYCVSIPLFVQPQLAVKVPTLHDDRIYDPWGDQWYPELAWQEKK